MPEYLDSSDLREEEFQNPGVEFEHTQADLRIVYGFLIMLAIGVALVFFVLWGFYAYMERKQGIGIAPAPYVYSKPPAIPAPRLQRDPVADDNRVRVDERQWLNTYGWADQNKRAVHIPIDRAMDLLVQRGLPSGQTSNPNSATGPYPGAAREQQGVNRP